MKDRILLFGYGDYFAVPSLKSLLKSSLRVVGVVARPDNDVEINELARQNGVPVFQATRINQVRKLIDQLRPEMVVVSSYDKVLPRDILDISTFINIHPSLLPKYRGRAAVNWAVINGDKEFGVTIHEIDEGLDTGDIYYQERFSITSGDTITTLYERIRNFIEDNLAEKVELILDRGLKKVPQDHKKATYAVTRTPEDGLIDWRRSTMEIYNLIRAVTRPYPGAFSFLDGKEKITIWSAFPYNDERNYEGRIPGRVGLEGILSDGVVVLTGDGSLLIREIQPEGKSPMIASRYIKSSRQTFTDRLY